MIILFSAMLRNLFSSVTVWIVIVVLIQKYESVYVYNPLDWINGYYFPHIDTPHFSYLFGSIPVVLNPISLPPISGSPGPGLRTPLSLSQYSGTQVHHLLTLPDDWSASAVAAGQKWPVIVAYTGNYFPSLGSEGKEL